jgi:hypothetical protein
VILIILKILYIALNELMSWMLKWILSWIIYISKRIGIEDLVGYVYIVRIDPGLRSSNKYKCYT